MQPPKVSGNNAQRTHELRFYPLGRHRTEALDGLLFTPAVEAGANYILVQTITQNIRYTIDSDQPPTATSGFQLATNTPPLLLPVGGGSRQVRFFREAAGAILEYQFGFQ